jgi:acetolactate synthase-1/2/3 large subunit
VGEWVDLSEQHARTGGDVLVDVLTALGVDTAFGVVSVHNLPLVDALERRMRFVPVRQEQAAVGAADGYGRARQGLGVAVTSTGTGAGNAAGALVESLSAGSAVLHVTGQIDSRFLGSGRGVIHETRDQLGMLRAVSKQARSVVPGQAAGAVLQELAEVALALPAGPTSVEWPIDLQYLDGPVGAAQQQLAPAALDEEQLVRAAALLREARRPLVWAGAGTRGGLAAARRHGSCPRHEQLRPGRPTRGRSSLHRQFRRRRILRRPARAGRRAGVHRHALPLERDAQLSARPAAAARADRCRRGCYRARAPR